MARGLLVVISSPSGAGKTTICQRLTSEFPQLMFSVSVTTRRPRAGEVDGKDYRFVDAPTFQKMVDGNEFAEHAEVHGNRYGTTRAAVAEALEHGRDTLFDIDWQGGKQLKQQFPKDAVMLWILPPSLADLEERLKRRATDSSDVISRRLETAKQELRHYDLYDYLIKNDEIDRAYALVKSIYLAAVETRRGREHAERLLSDVSKSRM
jgi:guanylate kinase